MNGSSPTLTAVYSDLAALRRAWENDVCKGRLAVADDPGVPLLVAVTVALVVNGREVTRLGARTVHRGGGWLGLQVGAVPDDARAAIEGALAAPAPALDAVAEVVPEIVPELVPEIIPEVVPELVPELDAATVVEAESEAAPEPPPSDDGAPTEKVTHDARPLALRFPEMSASEKTQIALRGDRDGRLMVMKEANPDRLKLLVQNPRITVPELAALAANPGSPLDLLKLISDHPMLAQNEAIRVALVKNPRAPVPLVKQHLEKLSPGPLAQLGKSQHLRDEVRRLALKLVLNRRS